MSAVRRVEVPWDEPPWSNAYPRPTRFGAASAALLLEADALPRASSRADPLVAQLLAENAEAMLATLPKRDGTQQRVQEAIVALLPQGLPSTRDVARHLGSNERTLRRHLAAAGLTFAGLRDETLCAMAQTKLRNPSQSIGEIAFALGFSEVSAFHRTFKRWTGQTPGHFRRAAAVRT